jgi:hypothetical protein
MSDLREPIERDAIKETLSRLEVALTRLREENVVIRETLAGIKGRIELLPSVWTMAGLVIGIFMLALVLVRFGIPR